MLVNKIAVYINKIKFFLLFITILFTYFISLYSGPVVSDEIQIKYNTRNIVINNNIGFSISSDTGNWMRLANKPSLLFEDERFVNDRELTAGNVGLSKPASFILVYILSQPIKFILNLLPLDNSNVISNVQESLNEGYRVGEIDQTVSDTVPNLNPFISTYMGWVVLNLIIISLSFFFFCKSLNISILKLSSYSNIGLWLGCFFIINDITKIYFISPNPAIFNLLASSLTIYSCSQIMDKCSINNLLKFSFIFGFLNLFYEIFFAPYSVLILFYLKVMFIDNQKKIFYFLNNSKFFLLSFILFISPYVVWIFVTNYFFGGFFHFGIDDNPGFSILNNDFPSIVTRMISLGKYGYKLAILSSFPIIIILLFLIINNLINKNLYLLDKNYFFIFIAYSFIIFLFFSLFGQIGTRHTIGPILILLPLIYYFLPKKIYENKSKIIVLTAGFFFIYSIYVARKTFPFGEGHLLNPFI